MMLKKQMASQKEAILSSVARPGFEPRQTEPKSVVLPLYYRAIPPALSFRLRECKNKAQRDKYQTESQNLKSIHPPPLTSNFQPQTSNLQPQTSNLHLPTSNFHPPPSNF